MSESKAKMFMIAERPKLVKATVVFEDGRIYFRFEEEGVAIADLKHVVEFMKNLEEALDASEKGD